MFVSADGCFTGAVSDVSAVGFVVGGILAWPIVFLLPPFSECLSDGFDEILSFGLGEIGDFLGLC